MARLNTLLTLTLLSLATWCSRTQYSDIVEIVNSVQSSWTAELSSDIDYDDDDGLQRRLGAILGPLPFELANQNNSNDNEDSTNPEVVATSGDSETEVQGSGKAPRRPRKLQTTAPTSAYPASLDLRTKYPQCLSVSLIRNQGNCGSCWAFSALNSLSDRYCIKKSTPYSTLQKFFSVQDVLECCRTCNGGSGNGCYGGIPYYAFEHAKNVGVVSGETVSLNGFCKPYFLELRAPLTNTAPVCGATCTNPISFGLSYTLDLYKSQGTVFGVGEAQMIAALNNGGSISVAFTVYQDFYAYRGGIYRHVTGSALGGHAVRCIGYGEENGVKYWLIANSWGRYWGEGGFFRIVRGTNDSGIESNYFAAGIIN